MDKENKQKAERMLIRVQVLENQVINTTSKNRNQRVAQIGKLREARELREQARGLISREYYDWLLWRMKELSKREY